MVATRDDISHIACLDSIITVFVHQLIRLFDMPFVILCRRRGFMVHQDLNTFRVCILIKHLDIEVRIRSDKVEDITLPHIRPVFPADIPAFYQYLVESVLRSKVDIAFYLLIIGSMTTIGFYFCPINIIEFDAGKLIGVVPTTLADNHLPPYTTIFRRMNPRRIFNLTRLIEVEDEVRREHVTGIVTYHHSAPRRFTGCLHTAF